MELVPSLDPFSPIRFIPKPASIGEHGPYMLYMLWPCVSVIRLRIILTGNASGLRHVLREMVRTSPDMEIVGELGDSPTLAELIAAVLDFHADVAFLDFGKTWQQQPADLERCTQTDLVPAILQRIPSLIVVALESLGRRAIVHSAIYIEDVGLNALFNAIRAARQNSAASRNC